MGIGERASSAARSACAASWESARRWARPDTRSESPGRLDRVLVRVLPAACAGIGHHTATPPGGRREPTGIAANRLAVARCLAAQRRRSAAGRVASHSAASLAWSSGSATRMRRSKPAASMSRMSVGRVGWRPPALIGRHQGLGHPGAAGQRRLAQTGLDPGQSQQVTSDCSVAGGLLRHAPSIRDRLCVPFGFRTLSAHRQSRKWVDDAASARTSVRTISALGKPWPTVWPTATAGTSGSESTRMKAAFTPWTGKGGFA